MKITWYGTAALMIEEEGFRLAVDPYVSATAVGMSDAQRYNDDRTKALKNADAILVTHGHFDHIYDIPTLFKDSAAQIYATKTPCESLTERGVRAEKITVIAPGDMLHIGPFDVAVYQGRHCRFDAGVIRQTLLRKTTAAHPGKLLKLWKRNMDFPESGETLFYQLHAGGKTVQLMGSMGMDESAAYPADADLLILPFQGTGDPAKTVAPIIDKLCPKRILLDHYDDAFPPLSSQVRTEDFVVKMNGKGILTEAMKVGKAYTI